MAEITAGELAGQLHLPIRGDTKWPIGGASKLEDAAPDRLSFVGSPKYFEAGLKSRAGCVIAPPEYPGAEGQVVIESPQPRAHFAQALALLYPERPAVPGIALSACIDPGARIAGSAEVGPHGGTVEIGDDVEIGANTCIDRGSLGATLIGDGAKLDNMVHVAHNCRIGRHVAIAAQTGFAGGVTVGDYAIVGGQVGVGDKARIESKAVIGSGAGILTSKIVRAGEPVWGTPARPLRQYLGQLAALARLAKRNNR